MMKINSPNAFFLNSRQNNCFNFMALAQIRPLSHMIIITEPQWKWERCQVRGVRWFTEQGFADVSKRWNSVQDRHSMGNSPGQTFQKRHSYTPGETLPHSRKDTLSETFWDRHSRSDPPEETLLNSRRHCKSDTPGETLHQRHSGTDTPGDTPGVTLRKRHSFTPG